MPKVGSELIRARSGNKYHNVDIIFYKKTTDFRPSKLPEGFDNWHGKVIAAETYDDCVNKVTTLVRDYWDASVQQRKMIAYKCKAHLSSDRLTNAERNNMMWCSRYGLGSLIYIEYKIYWEVILGEKKFYSQKPYKPDDKDGTMLAGGAALRDSQAHDFRDLKFAPHTDELEAFFKNTQDSMNKIIEKINSFFEVEPENLIEKIKDVKLLGR